MKCREAFYVNQFVWPTCKKCIGSTSQVVYTSFYCQPKVAFQGISKY